MKQNQAPTQTSLNAKSTENQCFYFVARAENLSNQLTLELNEFSEIHI
ncbi:hypothetical protein N8475_03505 [Winogradskyella sp.]|nr:hypothetical protein [Winogradskyella sp.]